MVAASLVDQRPLPIPWIRIEEYHRRYGRGSPDLQAGYSISQQVPVLEDQPGVAGVVS